MNIFALRCGVYLRAAEEIRLHALTLSRPRKTCVVYPEKFECTVKSGYLASTKLDISPFPKTPRESFSSVWVELSVK